MSVNSTVRSRKWQTLIFLRSAVARPRSKNGQVKGVKEVSRGKMLEVEQRADIENRSTGRHPARSKAILLAPPLSQSRLRDSLLAVFLGTVLIERGKKRSDLVQLGQLCGHCDPGPLHFHKLSRLH